MAQYIHDNFTNGIFTNTQVNSNGTVSLTRKNLLENSSFEWLQHPDSTQYGNTAWRWTLYRSGGEVDAYTSSLENSITTNGLRSQKVTFTSNSGKSLFILQTRSNANGDNIKVNTSYTFSIYANMDDQSKADLSLRVQYYKNNVYLSESRSTPYNPTFVTRMSHTFTVADADEIRVGLDILPKNDLALPITVTVWLDDSQLEEGSSLTEYVSKYSVASGEYISDIIDFNMLSPGYHKLEITASSPYDMIYAPTLNIIQSSFNIQIKSANTIADIQTAQWYGLSSTSDYYTCDTGNKTKEWSVNQTHKDNRYLQYRVVMDVNDSLFTINPAWSPILYDVRISYDKSIPEVRGVTMYRNHVDSIPINLIQNAGLDTPNPAYINIPDKWETYHTTTNQIYSYEIGMEGNGKSVAIEILSREENRVALWIQTLTVDSTKTYKLSGYIKTQNVVGGGNATIGGDWKKEDNTYIGESKLPYIEGTSKWKYCEGIIVPPSLETKKVTIKLSMKDCSGKAWFDNISLYEYIPEISYAYYPGDLLDINIDVVEWKGINSISQVTAQLYDNNTLYSNLNIETYTDKSTHIRNYKFYTIQIPYKNKKGFSPVGYWKVQFNITNTDGNTHLESTYLKIREEYKPIQKMELGVIEKYLFEKTISSTQIIDEYKKWKGIDVWKIGLKWSVLESIRGKFDSQYIQIISDILNAAYESEVKVQIGIGQQFWPDWVNNSRWDNGSRYKYPYEEYIINKYISETYQHLHELFNSYPALRDILIIAEENNISQVSDVEQYIKSNNPIISKLKDISDNKYRVVIRPNTIHDFIRTIIDSNGNQDVDYGTGFYPTSSAWWFPHYANPVSDTSFIYAAMKERKSPIIQNGVCGIGEIGYGNGTSENYDEEKLIAFKRQMAMAYELGYEEFYIWSSGFRFIDIETYFPKLKQFRDELIRRLHISKFNVRLLIDNNESLVKESFTQAIPEFDMKKEPYYFLIKTLDESGYSWYYTSHSSDGIQRPLYDTTIYLSEITGHTESEQLTLIQNRTDNLVPNGNKYPWDTGETTFNESYPDIALILAIGAVALGILGLQYIYSTGNKHK